MAKRLSQLVSCYRMSQLNHVCSQEVKDVEFVNWPWESYNPGEQGNREGHLTFATTLWNMNLPL